MRLGNFITDVKRAETPYHRKLKDWAQRVIRFEIPMVPPIHRPLYEAHVAVVNTADYVSRVLYYQPLFRARAEVGPGLHLYGGIPYVYGDLRIKMGRNCKLSAHTSLVSGHLFDDPTLTIGDFTNIGYGVTISVSKAVTLGSYVRIADHVRIADNHGHPSDPFDRRTQPVSRDSVRPVVIEDDVWIGTGSIIHPGVRIGRGSIVGAGSVVIKDVPPMSVVAGNPAKVIKTLEAALP